MFTHTAWCTKSSDAWEKNTNNKFPLYTIFDKNNYDSFQFAPYTLTFVRYDNAVTDKDNYNKFSEIKMLVHNILLQQKKEGYRFDINGSCSQIVLKYFMNSNLYQYIDYNEINNRPCFYPLDANGITIYTYWDDVEFKEKLINLCSITPTIYKIDF